jgi:hypothetical protein
VIISNQEIKPKSLGIKQRLANDVKGRSEKNQCGIIEEKRIGFGVQY